jgi:hypothetical protein
MIKNIKDWNETRKRRAAMNLFMRLYKDPKSTMQQILNEAAYKMAREMFMRMLDAEGFMHCRMCPIRGPLRKIADVMMCDLHYNQAMKAHEELSTKTKETNHAPHNGTKESLTGSKSDPSAI